MKSIFEEMGGTYSKVGDYYIPNLALPPEKKYFIGRFGRMHLKFIKEYKRGFYTSLLTSCKLNLYLYELDEQATERFNSIVAALAKTDGTDENLKAADAMHWVGLMNNYRNSAEEIVLKELVYT